MIFIQTAMPEATVKTKRIESTKWTDHEEWTFTSKCFIFL